MYLKCNHFFDIPYKKLSNVRNQNLCNIYSTKEKKEYPHYVNEYYGVGVISLLAWNSICILQTRLLSTTTLIQL